MNNERRKEIEKVQTEFQALCENFANAISEIQSQVESIRDDEQSYLDDMPESFKSGEKGQAAQDAIEALEEACTSFDEFENWYTGIDSNLETATA